MTTSAESRTDREQLFVGTRWVPATSSSVLEVSSPTTGETIGRVAQATPLGVDAMVSEAREAFDRGEWSRATPEDRGALLARVADELERRQGEVCELLSAEMGSPPATAAMMQVLPAVANLRYYSELAGSFPWTELREGVFGTSVVSRNPIGVAAAITAWNVPVYLVCAKLAPALLAGNSVVLKPAPETPLSALWVADLFRAAGLPEGVLSVAVGGSSVGEHLVEHPGVEAISFTGSTAVGRRIGEIAGRRLVRCSLELGGKSAALVLPDADPQEIAGTLAFSALMNSGQACVSQNRILVPRSRHDEVLAAVVEAVRGMTTGTPDDETTVLGPLASERHRERVEEYLRAGVEEGARIAYQAEGMPGTGAFVPPTVFADVDNSMRIAREEIFGPVIEMLAYDTVDEAVAIANDSDYGLAGAVYSADPDAALAVARRLETGTVGVNWYAFDPCAPFGGYKNSGLGRENGPEGLESYCELQSVIMPAGWTPPPGGQPSR